MDQEKMQPQDEDLQPEQEPSVPRPAWQVWAARIGLVLFIVFILLYYLNICGVTL